MDWSAQKYSQFEDERTRPVRDLLGALQGTTVHRAIDIGCGPGNSTEVLAARFPGARVEGLDSSPDMIDAARRRLPGVPFAVASIDAWQGEERFDVILANAVLQWLPDHRRLLPRLVARLNPGGALAVQMPDNLAEPAHVLLRAVAADGPWTPALSQASGERTSIESAQTYYRLLEAHCRRVEVWRTTYFHRLEGGPRAVVEWFRATALRPYLARLDEALSAEFLDAYQQVIASAYPAADDGSVLLPFPRLFILAER